MSEIAWLKQLGDRRQHCSNDGTLIATGATHSLAGFQGGSDDTPPPEHSGPATSIAMFGLLAVSPALAGDTFKVLHWFNGKNGEQPANGLTFDTSGNLYGTTYSGGAGSGTVFELSPKAGGG